MPTDGRASPGRLGRDGFPEPVPRGRPDDSDEEARRDELAERTEAGRPLPAGEGSSDILPEVEVPEHQM